MKHNLPAILYFNDDGEMCAASHDCEETKLTVTKIDGFFLDFESDEHIVCMYYHSQHLYVATNKNRLEVYEIKKGDQK